MSLPLSPQGEEREVKTLGGASLDGSPLAYIVVLAAVVTVLAFIPFSIVLASGGSFPLSQGIYALVGWILGPIAGAVASGMGTLIGIFLAPYTAGVPVISIWGAIVGSFTAGSMVLGKRRQYWWFILTIVFVLEFFIYIGHAVWNNGVSLPTVIAGSFVNWSSIILFALPTRSLFARWIHSQNIGLVAVGLFWGTWMVSGVTHQSQVTITYFMFNWPEAVWLTLIPIMPFENLIRSLVGAVIGTGVISGLRAIGLVKPKEAIY